MGIEDYSFISWADHGSKKYPKRSTLSIKNAMNIIS